MGTQASPAVDRRTCWHRTVLCGIVYAVLSTEGEGRVPELLELCMFYIGAVFVNEHVYVSCAVADGVDFQKASFSNVKMQEDRTDACLQIKTRFCFVQTKSSTHVNIHSP